MDSDVGFFEGFFNIDGYCYAIAINFNSMMGLLGGKKFDDV